MQGLCCNCVAEEQPHVGHWELMLEESDWGLLPSTPAMGSSLGLLGDWREHGQSCAIERERISHVWDPAESWGVLSSLALRPALPDS